MNMQIYSRERFSGRTYEKVFVLAALLLTSFIYYYKVLHYWFILDDPAAMVSSLDTIWQIFFKNSYSFTFYTPLLPLSLKPDVMMFGMDPFPYHFHNMVVLALTSFMVFLILRPYTDRMSSLVAASIVLFSAPSLVCVIWITLRQYIYSMFFALVSVYLYLKYQPDLKRHRSVLLIIMVFCELSFMGKEQYMTLPFVLFLLSDGSLRQRVYKTFPFFLLLAGHFVLRWHVLGGVGGYIGAQYDHAHYAKTVVFSMLTNSNVLFGFSWLIVFVFLPFVLQPKKLLLAWLIWAGALFVSFVVMGTYPSSEAYRYWFIGSVLIACSIGLGASLIKKKTIRALYLILIAIAFFNHTLSVTGELKNLFGKKALAVKQVTATLVDARYRGSIILFPQEEFIVGGSRFYYFSMALKRIEHIETFPTYYPLELLAFYPKILEEYNNIYRMKDGSPDEISGKIKKEIDLFRASLVDEKPNLKLLRNGPEADVSLKCISARAIAVFTIRKADDKYYMSRDLLPYLERFTLRLGNNISLFPVETLSYDDRDWNIEEKKMENGSSLRIGVCLKDGGKNTRLSDLIYVRREPVSAPGG